MPKKVNTLKKVPQGKALAEKKAETKKLSAYIEDASISWIIAGLYFFIMLIISFSQHKIGDYGIETDFFWSYVPQADKFLHGSIEIDKYRGPLYPIVLGIFKLFTGNYFSAGMLLAILSASLVLFFVHRLLYNLFNPLVALITTCLVAVNTTFNLYTYSAGTDMFFNCLVSAGIFFLLAHKEFKISHLIFTSLFAGLAYLTRYNGIFLFLTILAGLLLINIYRLDRGKRLINSLIFIVIFIAVIAPWGIYTHQKKGKAFWNQNYQNVAYEYLAKDKMGWDEFWYKGNREKYTSLTQVIFKEPKAFFSKAFSNAFEHLSRDLSSLIGWHISIFSLFGLLLLFTKPPDKRQWTYYLANLLFFGVLILVFYSERFSLFLIPFYTVFGVNAIFTENKYLKKAITGSAVLTYGIALLLIIWTFTKSYQYNSENINSGDKNLLKLRDEFRKTEKVEGQGKKIMARKAHIAYYLGLEMTWVDMVPDYYQQVAKIWKAGVDYVSYGIWEMGRGLNFLNDPSKLPPDFKLLAYVSSVNKVVMQKNEDKKTYNIKVEKQPQPALLYKVVMDEPRKTIKKAGEWLLGQIKNPQDSIKILCASPYLPAYCGGKFEQLPDADIQYVLDYAKAKNADYIYLGEIEAAVSPTAYQSFMSRENAGNIIKVLDLSKENSPAVLLKVK